MMLNQLFQAALLNLSMLEGDNLTTQREDARHRRIVEAQIELAKQALRMLKSVHADIEALRIDGGDVFEGTGDCEFGHEEVGIKFNWPNLAILSDDIDCLLKKVTESSTPNIWFVFHGDCSFSHRCEAQDREEAMELCALAFPGSTVHVAVPATCHGELVMEGYGEDPVSCPKCGARTELGELPRDGWQVHVCQRCDHSFIAVPDEDEKARYTAMAHVCGRCDLHSVVQVEKASVDPQQRKINAAEVIADIAFTAGHLFGTGNITAPSDSRQLMSDIADWAYAFEAVFDSERHGDDYMGLVDEYAALRIFGDHVKAETFLKSMSMKVAA